MTRIVTITAQAEADLDGIFAWTIDRFGPRQAERYLNALTGHILSLTDPLQPVRPLRAILEESDPDLSFVHSGRHIILMRTRGERIAILTVLHQSTDLATKIAGLIKQAKDH